MVKTPWVEKMTSLQTLIFEEKKTYSLYENSIRKNYWIRTTTRKMILEWFKPVQLLLMCVFFSNKMNEKLYHQKINGWRLIFLIQWTAVSYVGYIDD